jgi:hypothetical protein
MKTITATALLLAALQCSPAATNQAACSPEAHAAIKAGFDVASDALIASGECDAYELVDDCPKWRALELGATAAYAAWDRCGQ